MKTFICLAISSLLVGLLYVYVRQQLAQVNANIASLTAMMRTVAEVTAQNGMAAQTNHFASCPLPTLASESSEDDLQEVSDDEYDDEEDDDCDDIDEVKDKNNDNDNDNEDTVVKLVEDIRIIRTSALEPSPFASSPVGIMDTSPISVMDIMDTSSMDVIDSLAMGVIDTSPIGVIDTSPIGVIDTSPIGVIDTSPIGVIDTSPIGVIDTSSIGVIDTSPISEIVFNSQEPSLAKKVVLEVTNYSEWNIKALKEKVNQLGGPGSLKTKKAMVEFLEKNIQ
jgi:hypothetical protein